jgi:hydroxymethylpyrimidine/phosphomethylpyrimidine kinase
MTVDIGSHYYLVSFSPSDSAEDPSFQVGPASLSATLEALEYQTMKVGMLSNVEIAMVGKARAKKQSEAH